jgi:hypothetical protein
MAFKRQEAVPVEQFGCLRRYHPVYLVGRACVGGGCFSCRLPIPAYTQNGQKAVET